MFERLAPFIRDYIYREKWDELRDIQVAACHVILDTNDHLLLSSGTASGKTEAAFLPVLTKLYENQSKSVGVLYVSPLKALINDQFERIYDLIAESDIKVTKWHGDASQTEKNKLLKKPEGIIQTTPESLEAMLMRRKTDVIKLFSDLKYIIIDEVHYFMTEDRGTQLLGILERLQRICNIEPVRIGLSATVGDYNTAEKWLSTGTKRKCQTPGYGAKKRVFRLAMKYFPVNYHTKSKENEELLNNYYNCLYETTFSKKCIIFSNSKAEVEDNIANIKKIALKKRTGDVYFAHHGNVSAGIREYAETTMKSSEMPVVTGATVTLELGIDLGELERIVQTGAPLSVSSFVQRLGRAGRRDKPSEMFFVFREDTENKNADFYKAINWDLIMCLAIVQLYLEEKWIEPDSEKKLPYGILYHQTMSFLASAGEVSPGKLAENMLTLEIFRGISQDDYKIMLNYMIEKEQIELTENKGISLGIKGEWNINKYDFYSVFETKREFSVKCVSEEIGKVEVLFPIGESFALAGKTWEVTSIDGDSDVIYVKELKGVSTNKWTSEDSYTVHTKIVRKMREILKSDTVYRYMDEKTAERLSEIRHQAKGSGILDISVVKITNNMNAVFPWLGTRELVTLSYALDYFGVENSVYIKGHAPLCIFIKNTSIEEIEEVLKKIKEKPLNKWDFNIPENACILGKFNENIPPQLLRKQYIEDYLEL